MKKYRFKKVFLVIACFSLVLVVSACASNGSHDSISIAPDNTSTITFPETAEDDEGLFYQTIYNSNVNDPDAEPGTVYGRYKGTFTGGNNVTFVVSKPKLPETIANALSENGLKYFVISLMLDDEDYFRSHSTMYAFKDEASYNVISRDRETIKAHGRNATSLVIDESKYMEIGPVSIDDKNFSKCNTSEEDYILIVIDDFASR